MQLRSQRYLNRNKVKLSHRTAVWRSHAPAAGAQHSSAFHPQVELAKQLLVSQIGKKSCGSEAGEPDGSTWGASSSFSLHGHTAVDYYFCASLHVPQDDRAFIVSKKLHHIAVITCQ